jgi:hypothetical protein
MMRAALVMGVALLAACPAATSTPVPDPRLAAVPEADRELAESLLDAEQVVAGRLVSVAEAEEYERPGSFVFGVQGSKAVAALAYSGVLHVDSTLLGRAARTLPITFFAAPKAAIPKQDTTAIWVLHRRVLWRLKECAERQGVTSTACPSDQGLALDSNDDVRPLTDWPRLQTIIRALGLQAGRR